MPIGLAIHIEGGTDPWAVFEESEHPFSVRIGRGGHSELAIPKDLSSSLRNTVSREHARLFKAGGRYWLEDLGSNNLTLLNGKVVFSPERIALPATVHLGKLSLQLKQVSSRAVSAKTLRSDSGCQAGVPSESITLGLSADFHGQIWGDIRERMHWVGALLEIADATARARRADALIVEVCNCLASHLRVARVELVFDCTVQCLQRSLDAMGLLDRVSRSAAKELAEISQSRPLLRVDLPESNAVLWGILNSRDAESTISLALAVLADVRTNEMIIGEQADAVVALSMRLAGPIQAQLRDVEALRADTKDTVSREPSASTLEVSRRAKIIGESPQFRYCLYCAEQAARRYLAMISGDGKPGTLFISGETGTGKSALARLIHALSDRARKPFHELNCAAIPVTLAESELFGYVKGAFAQAFTDRAGFFEVADGGVLFLDEIGKTSVDFQGKLLKVLDTGEFTRLGSSTTRRTTCHVILAASEDAETLIKYEKLLAELWYRTGAFTINLPPLRERPGDTRLIAERMVTDLNNAHPNMPAKRISDKAMALFLAHSWPGNVRELVGCLRAAYALAPEVAREIGVDHLPKTFMKGLGTSESALRSLVSSADVRVTLDQALDQAEREYLVLMLRECEGNLAEVARRAQKAYQTLHTKLNSFRAWLAQVNCPAAEAERERLRALAGQYWPIIERGAG